MLTNQIVILAAGKGKRMFNPEIPKVLVMLKNKPLILHLLEEVEKLTLLSRPVIVVGYKAETVTAVLGENYIYARQKEQLGTANAVWSAKQKIKAKNILVLYGDMPFIKAESLKKIIGLHLKSKAKISMFTASVPDFKDQFSSLKGFGRIIRENSGKIVKITEFKDASEEEKLICEVNPGIYMFDTEWFWKNINQIKNNNAQGEYYLTDIIEVAIKDREEIQSASISPNEVLGVNTQEELSLAESLL